MHAFLYINFHSPHFECSVYECRYLFVRGASSGTLSAPSGLSTIILAFVQEAAGLPSSLNKIMSKSN